ncbi:N-acetylmuramoyl-L-alanine amidase [Bacillus sp. DTU_2020_1000418_1_SI_GHA_SEK_038]|uniref:N-acetylmuramoyl-L-alanine amidase n=1 Tax=Bacillus sp. DTU_2020_1000418_1_SI_GHA_SEK_038 TaxID=3077585 RepID=UPI0028E87BDA|nr:SH3 domain-containing protein [Bacillus sp. DTU_2020_1000418_1_SI_GHA_SEK_038]WNS75106.1 N-acetylmuramoyl-L-alanine amidase [Bacillus sp. DTU_2020_1000418_1_SI_GHA_SEK_038]
MKKLIASSVLATAALFPAIVQAENLAAPTSMLVDQKVEIRKGATTAYPLVTSLPIGKSVTVIDEFINSAGETWYRVDLGSKQGWGLASRFTENSTNQSPLQTGSLATITGDQVNVRKGATTSYAVVTKLSKGTKVKVIDTFKNSKGELWYRIEVGSIKGWVIQSYLTPVTDSKPAPPSIESKTIQSEKAAVRKGATGSYSIVTYVYKNQKITIIDTFKNAAGETWYRADLGTVKGWIHEDAFKPTANLPSPPDTETPSLPEVGSYVYSSQNGIDVRKGATDSYASVAKLSVNQKVKVVDQFIHTNGTAWLRVEVTPTLLGWVPANTISATESINIDLYVSVAVANLRSGPSTNDSVIDQATMGTLLTAIDKAYDTSGDLWYKALNSSNQTVWVHETVVSTQPTFSKGATLIVGASNISLHSGASTQYKVKEVLKKDSKITFVGDFTNSLGQYWLQVKSSTGNTGWIQDTHMNSLQLLEKKLLSPEVTSLDGHQYLNWKKPSKYSISYSTLSSNRLKLSGGLTDVDLPKGNIPGIQSVETIASGSEKSVIVTFEPGYSFTIRDYNDKLSIKIVPLGLLGKHIIVDAGHGGKDSGAVGPTGLREKDVNLGTALILKEELEAYGAIVTLTRSTDIFLELSQRTDIANRSQADAFISIHGDSFSSTSNGTTTYYNSTVNFNGPRSKTLGTAIQKNMVSSMNTYNRGVKEQVFYVNRMNELPSVLVELAFLSNPKEEALLKTTEFRKKAAVGITKGLEEYFNNF